MSTKVPPCLDSNQVSFATQILRVYKHKFRFAIISRLLEDGEQTSSQIAEGLGLNENYIDKQLDVLLSNGFVDVDFPTGSRFYRVNQRQLSKVNAAVRNFSKS